MTKHTYEIEIKSLLGGKDKADALVEKMKAKDPNLQVLGSHKQLNHYFTGGNLDTLYDNVQNLLDDGGKNNLKDISTRAKAKSRTEAIASGTGNFSVRTRDADGKIILVVKASVDDTTSSNGTARLEFEAVIPAEAGILTIDDLDKLILTSGFSYQAKWSRERSDYKYLGANVSIDKNAGYGYLTEFEKVTDDETKATELKDEIRKIMAELDVLELNQDRLARMFDYYNKNWGDYYGTEKIFNIE